MGIEAQKEFSRRDYWDDRYKKESQEQSEAPKDKYEWYATYEKLKPFLDKHLSGVPKTARLLHLGCGTSSLSADLHGLGYSNQLNIDFSNVAIQEMKQRYNSLGLEWEVMDVRKMSLQDRSIDVALDKGTLNAMLYGSGPDFGDDVKEHVGAYVNEVARILKPSGKWLFITHEQPRFVQPLLLRPDTWDLQQETVASVPGSFEYFGFVMTRHGPAVQ